MDTHVIHLATSAPMDQMHRLLGDNLPAGILLYGSLVGILLLANVIYLHGTRKP